MTYFEWLRGGSEDHAIGEADAPNFTIVPKSDTEDDRRAFQAVARETLANSGDGYLAREHVTHEWGLKGWDRAVYDFVAIMPAP